MRSCKFKVLGRIHIWVLFVWCVGDSFTYLLTYSILKKMLFNSSLLTVFTLFACCTYICEKMCIRLHVYGHASGHASVLTYNKKEKLWPSVIGTHLGRNRSWVQFLAVSDIYPMFVEPSIPWVRSGFCGYIQKLCWKKREYIYYIIYSSTKKQVWTLTPFEIWQIGFWYDYKVGLAILVWEHCSRVCFLIFQRYMF